MSLREWTILGLAGTSNMNIVAMPLLLVASCYYLTNILYTNILYIEGQCCKLFELQFARTQIMHSI